MNSIFSFFRDIFFRNIFLKIISLVFAIILWFFATHERSVKYEVYRDVTILITNKPEDLWIASEVPEKLRIAINGPRLVLKSIQSEDLSYYVDVSGVNPGSQEFRIKDYMIRGLPHQNVDVTAILPDIIHITFDRAKRIRLPVQVQTSGFLHPGFELVSIKVDPLTVEVLGAEQEVRNLSAIMTEAVDISGKTTSTTVDALLDLPNHSVTLPTTKVVSVFLELKESDLPRTFQVTLEILGKKGNEISYTPHLVAIEVTGPYHLLEKMTPDDFQLQLDLTDRAPGEYTLRPQLIAPKEVRLLAPALPEIKVMVRKRGDLREDKKSALTLRHRRQESQSGGRTPDRAKIQAAAAGNAPASASPPAKSLTLPPPKEATRTGEASSQVPPR